LTNQEKKEQLQKYREADGSLNQKLEELSRLKALCCKVTTTMSDMPKGGCAVKEDTYIRMIELGNEINTDIDALVDKRHEIEQLIMTVGNPTLQTLLRYRYINGDKWDVIATKMGYEVSNVFKLHGQALGALSIDIFPV